MMVVEAMQNVYICLSFLSYLTVACASCVSAP